jgi:hypothetical protein
MKRLTNFAQNFYAEKSGRIKSLRSELVPSAQGCYRLSIN